jgi:MarR family transcriptional regulator for hemolysin
MATNPEPTHERCRARREGDFGWHVGTLLRAYEAAVAEVVADVPHGSRGYQVLDVVVHGDQPTQVALAAHLGIDRTVMTYLIDDLVEADLVRREQSPTDRRARRVVATATGRATLTELERRVRAAEDATMGVLAPAEREVLRGLLRRVACGLRDIDVTGAGGPPVELPMAAVRS